MSVIEQQISRFITRDRYACRCCGSLPPGLIADADEGGAFPECFEHLFATFDELCRRLGRAIEINSGYRCTARNAAIGGGKLSAHLFGLALDLNIRGDDVSRAVSVLRDIDRRIRIGYRQYKGALVHIDTAFYIWPRPSVHFVEGGTW